MITNLMHYSSSVYFVSRPLHVSGVPTRPTDGQLKGTPLTNCFIYIYIYIYSIPPDDGLQICPKHVDVDWRNKLRINSASSWFSLHGCYSVVISGGAHREVMANRPDIAIKNKKRENIHTDRCSNTCGQKCHIKGSRKEAKIQEFVCRVTILYTQQLFVLVTCRFKQMWMTKWNMR